MHNFGRGMWRRVGDYERIQQPILVQQYIQHQLLLQKQKEHIEKQKIKSQDEHIHSMNKSTQLNEIEMEKDLQVSEINEDLSDDNVQNNDNNINENILTFQPVVDNEVPKIIPKKTKRKNKK